MKCKNIISQKRSNELSPLLEIKDALTINPFFYINFVQTSTNS